MTRRIIISSLVLGAVTIAVLLVAGIYLADSNKLIYIVLFCLAMPGVAVSLLVCLQGPSTGTGICGTYGWGGLILVFNYAIYSCVWLVILKVWQRYKRGRHK
jgi:hypothetical protein